MKKFPIVLVLMLITQTARAEDSIIDFRLGVKGVFTGLLWSAPDNKPVFLDDASQFWGDDQFYIGGGVGPFFEINLLRYLGLELDLLYEANSLTFNQTYNFGNFELEYDYDTEFQQMRLPILIKGVLPLADVAELSLGIGPEFVFGLDAEVEIDRRTDLGAANNLADQTLADTYDAEKTGGVFFDIDLGVAIKVWKLIIPIDLRVGINLDQPADYEERVDLDVATNQVQGTVKAIESYNFAALIGIGYVFKDSESSEE